MPQGKRFPFLPVILFLLTVASTLFTGCFILSSDSPELQALPQSFSEGLLTFFKLGAPFSFTIMAILLSHEMGHYLTARYYRVKATLPHFIPFPLSLVGTLGAFILIKSPFPHRRALIDIGLAGPIAGFLVTLPALYVGIQQSSPGPPLGTDGISLGEPLLFQWFSAWIWPNLPDGQVLYISPVGLAAWFGLLATAINLIPIGQLDGGHATYALFRQYAHRISRWAFFLLFPLAYFGPNWLIWALLAFVLGIRRPHPPTLYDPAPLPRSRKLMGLAGLVILVLSFTPEPIVFSWAEVFEPIQSYLGL
jgi:membrane-associated protease RseP (regulator of RpoE activity)